MLTEQLNAARAAQNQMRTLTNAFKTWADTHRGLTLLLVPDHIGSFVAARNAQGGLAMPPLQAEGRLHRIMPTLLSDLPVAHEQFNNGLAGQLAIVQPTALDEKTVAAMWRSAAASFPEYFACWAVKEGRRTTIGMRPWLRSAAMVS